MIESGDACEDDYSIKLSVAVVSIQWTKKGKGSLIRSLLANNLQQAF